MSRDVVIVKGGMDTEEFMRSSSGVRSNVSSVSSVSVEKEGDNDVSIVGGSNVEIKGSSNGVDESSLERGVNSNIVSEVLEGSNGNVVEQDNVNNSNVEKGSVNSSNVEKGSVSSSSNGLDSSENSGSSSSVDGDGRSVTLRAGVGVSKAGLLLKELGIDIEELEKDETHSIDSYLRRAKESFLQSQDIKTIKSTVKLEELKKIEKKLAKSFGLKEEEIKDKTAAEIIDYVSGKYKGASEKINYGDNAELETNRAGFSNPLLKIGSQDIYGSDGVNKGSNKSSDNEGEGVKGDSALQSKLNILAAEGKSLDALDPNRNAQLALNLLKTEKENLSKELTEKSNKLLEYESELEKLRSEKERLEKEELAKYKAELEQLKSESHWKWLEDKILSYVPGMNVVLPEVQLRHFVFPDLRKYLETKYVLEKSDNGEISLTLRFGTGKGELKKEIYDYFRKNNLIARNNFTKTYMENLMKMQAQGIPEPDSNIGGAAYLAEAQKNLERIKQNL